MLESLAFTHQHRTSARYASSMSGAEHDRRRSTMADDQTGSQWTTSTSLSESLGLIRMAKQDSYASDAVIVEELITVFLRRVNNNVGHVIYGPGIRRASQAFLNMSEEEIVISHLFVDPCALACLLLVLCLGFEFHPSATIANAPPSPGWRAVDRMRKHGIDPSGRWYALAKKCLKVESSFELTSVAALQAACLFLFRGKETVAWSRMLLGVAVSSAQDFGLHRLGEARRKTGMDVNDFIRLETGVRIWTYLCISDWSSAGAHGLAYMIQPSQMTTRMPLNINDEDLEKPHGREEPLEKWTEGAYVLAQFQLAECIRDSVDVRNEQAIQVSRSEQDDQTVDEEKQDHHRQRLAIVGSLASLSDENRDRVQARIVTFVEELPRFFHIDSDVAFPLVVPVQRWLLHQQIFDMLMKLNRGRLTTEEGREKCLTLAHNILNHQAEIRTVCPVIDHFAVNSSHTYSACIIVLLDLIARSAHLVDGEPRQLARERVAKAIDGLRGSGWITTGVRVLEVLMSYEEEQFGLSKTAHAARARGPALSEMAKKLVKEIGGASQPRSRHHVSNDWPAAQVPVRDGASGEYQRRQYDSTMLPVLGAFPPAKAPSPPQWSQGIIADTQPPFESSASRRPSLADTSSRASSASKSTPTSSVTSPKVAAFTAGAANGHTHADFLRHSDSAQQTLPFLDGHNTDFGQILDWAFSLGLATNPPAEEANASARDIGSETQQVHEMKPKTPNDSVTSSHQSQAYTANHYNSSGNAMLPPSELPQHHAAPHGQQMTFRYSSQPRANAYHHAQSSAHSQQSSSFSGSAGGPLEDRASQNHIPATYTSSPSPLSSQQKAQPYPHHPHHLPSLSSHLSQTRLRHDFPTHRT